MKQNGFLNMFINGVRRFSPTLAIAGFMALCSTASAETLQTNNINNNKAEWFSQEASDAISVMSLPINTKSIQQEPQKIPIFSKELHKIFKKVADIETVYAFEDNVYGQYGPYIGAVLVQMEVNSLAIQAFTAGDLETIGKISEEARKILERDPAKYYGSMRENKGKIDSLVCNTDSLVSEGLKSAYQSGKLKGESGKEVVEEICDIFRKNNLLDERDETTLLYIYDNIKKESKQEEMNAVAYIAKTAVDSFVETYMAQFYNKGYETAFWSTTGDGIMPEVDFISISNQLHVINTKFAKSRKSSLTEFDLYRQYGSYIGAALVQMEVNSMAIKAFTAGDLETIGKISEEARKNLERDPNKYYGSMRENKDKIDGLVCNIDNLVSEGLKSAYQSGKLKGESGQEVVEEICNIFRKNNLLDERDIATLLKIYDIIKKESKQEEMNAVAYIAKTAVNFSAGNDLLSYLGATSAFNEATGVVPKVQYK